LISFRYHLVSIVAVFLALALGVVVGTTVVNQGIVDDLKRRTNAAVDSSDKLKTQIAELNSQLEASRSFENIVMPMLIKDQLTGAEVLVVTQQDVSASDVDSVRRALIDGGASVLAEIVVTNRMALSDSTSQAALAGALGTVNSGAPEQLAKEAARAVGARLANGPGLAPSDDVLSSLDSAGFVVVRGETGISGIGGGGQAVVLLFGTTRPPAVDPGFFMAPLAAALVEAQRPVAAAETETTVAPFVPLLRDDGSLDGHLVTVDDADNMVGRLALVLGLRDLLASPGKGGDYGVKAGASALLPKP
jgi:copper transport outer membrane protein MctB